MKLMIPETAALSEAPESADVLSYTTSECALGQVLVARSTKGICAILMGDDGEGLLADLGARFPQATLVANGISVQDDLAKVFRFLEQPVDGLHLTLDMRGTSFQRRVWEKLRSISVGRTVTYSELARWISPPASPRAVAGACAANPIALAVPCHRVVSSNDDLAGYRWGIERKRELIKKEAMA
jgi:AraC family transcriptional regulator, regulatory protein of adaptative response / methylated-DNA-[protein]-cysteine methyltransferase